MNFASFQAGVGRLLFLVGALILVVAAGAPGRSVRRLKFFISRSFPAATGVCLGWLGLAALVLAGCSRESPSAGPQYGTTPPASAVPEYHFAVHPLHNPAKLIEAYQPLMDYLNARLKNARLSLEASRDYGAFEEKYQNRRPGFLLPNPLQTLQAMKAGYQVIATAGEPADFRGIFIVRKDSDIRQAVALSQSLATSAAGWIAAADVSGLQEMVDAENR